MSVKIDGRVMSVTEAMNVLNQRFRDAISVQSEQLQADNKDLAKAVKEWRLKADTELDINAGLHTENAKLQDEIKQLKIKAIAYL